MRQNGLQKGIDSVFEQAKSKQFRDEMFKK